MIPIPSRIYGQKDSKILVNGVPIFNLMDGSSIRVVFDGGEVDKTEGTDGPGLNIATAQGGTVYFTIRETSVSYNYLMGLFQLESALTGVTVSVVMMSGSRIVFTMPRALIGQPGELSTGDKKQGGVEFKIVGDIIFALASPI